MALGGVVRTQMQNIYLGQQVQWQMHFHWLGAGSTASGMGDLGAALVSWWNANLKGNTLDACSLVNIRMLMLEFTPAVVLDYNAGLPSDGTGGVSDALTQLAMDIDFRPISSTRHSRNRCFLPGTGAVNLNAFGYWDSGAVLAVITAFDALAGAVSAVDWEQVTVSVPQNAYYGAPMISVRNNPVTVGRRKIGRGR